MRYYEKYILFIFCATALSIQIISLWVFMLNCCKTPKYGPLLMQICDKTLFSETSPDGKYTVRLCEDVLVCSNNVNDTQYVDVYCVLNDDISSSNVSDENITAGVKLILNI